MLPPLDVLIGCKVGPAHEPSAVVVAHRIETLTGEFDKAVGRWLTNVRYQIPQIERLPGGSRPAELGEVIADIVECETEDGAKRITTLIDVTVPGLPLVDLLDTMRLDFTPVLIVEAPQPRAGGGYLQIPQRELISTLNMLMIDGRLVVGELEDAATLQAQIKEFRTREPAKDALAQWRPGVHADLAVAAMLACWAGERLLRPIVRQPPIPRQKIDPAQVPTFDQAVAANRKVRRRTARAS